MTILEVLSVMISFSMLIITIIALSFTFFRKK